MRTEVPSRVIIKCDCCERECGKEAGQVRRTREGGVTVKQHALDYHGCPIADGTVSRDLCDYCLDAVAKSINTACENVRAGIAPPVDQQEGSTQ